MKSRKRAIVVLGCWGSMLCFVIASGLVGCNKAGKEAQDRESAQYSKEQLSAQFPYDLGVATVDVSKYPQKIQDNYKTFLAVCSACHSSARPLNSPFVKAYDWKRFLKRMHIKIEERGFNLEPKDEKQIVEFLVYDSKIRKIDRKAEFEAEQNRLKALFEVVVKERDRLMTETVEKLPKKEHPYVGVK